MKQPLIKIAYNVAHSIIIILIMFDVVELIGRDTFPNSQPSMKILQLH